MAPGCHTTKFFPDSATSERFSIRCPDDVWRRVDPRRNDVESVVSDVSFIVADMEIATRGDVWCRQRRL